MILDEGHKIRNPEAKVFNFKLKKMFKLDYFNY